MYGICVPGIPTKRYNPCISPQQNPIPHIIKGYELRNGEIEFVGYIPNIEYYDEYFYVIQLYIDSKLKVGV